MIANWAPDAYYPARSLDLAAAIKAGRKLATVPAVLLGVDRVGAPVLHYARVEDGGSFSLLLCGHAEDVLVAIRASVAAWYDSVAYTQASIGAVVKWPDAELLIACRRDSEAWVSPSRCYAREWYPDTRGSWRYYPRAVPGRGCVPVGFHVVKRDWPECLKGYDND